MRKRGGPAQGTDCLNSVRNIGKKGIRRKPASAPGPPDDTIRDHGD